MAPRGKTATLSIVIAGDAKGAKKAASETDQAMTGLAGRMKGIAAGVGAAFAVTKVVQWGKAASDAYRTVGGEVIKLQRFTGLAAEEASALRLAASMSGVDVGKLATSLGQLNKRIESGSIDDLGFQFRDASAQILPMDQILAQIMDRFEGMENGPAKTALAMQLFGRAGAELLPLLSRGSAGLEEMKQKAEELGLSFSDLDLEQVKEATKNQREFNAAMLGMKVAVGKELQPLINDLTALAKTALPPVIGGLRTTIGLFTALPPQVQATAVGLGAASLVLPRLAAGIGTLVGGVGNLTTLYPRLSSALRNNVSNLSASTTGMAAAAAGVISYTAATAALNAAVESRSINVDVQGLATALENLGRTGESAGELNKYGDGLDRLAESFRNVNENYGDIGEDLLGGGRGLDLAKAAKDDLEDLDAALVSLVNTDGADAARKAYGELVSMLLSQGVAIEDIVASVPKFFEALETSEIATDNETEAIKENTNALDAGRAARDRAAAALDRRNTRVQAQRSAEDALTSAQDARTSALEDLADAERAAAAGSEENTAAAEAEADAADAVRDAVEAQRDAEQAVADANANVQEKREELNEAIAEAAERYEDLQLAARAAGDAERQAALDVRKAQEALEDILRSPASELEKEQAKLDLEQAQTDAAAAAEAARDAEAAAAQGPEQDEQVIAAKEALQGAIAGVSEAQERAREAADAVSDAEGRLQDAQRNTQQVAAETAAAVVEAKKAAEQATKDVIAKESELAAAGLNGEAAIRAQQTALREMANDYAPGSPYRTYIEDLIRDLGVVLGGLVGIGGDYASVDAADRGGPRGQGPAGNIPQDETRDPMRSRRPINVHLYGTATQERRHARRVVQDALDGAGRSFG